MADGRPGFPWGPVLFTAVMIVAMFWMPEPGSLWVKLATMWVIAVVNAHDLALLKAGSFRSRMIALLFVMTCSMEFGRIAYVLRTEATP